MPKTGSLPLPAARALRQLGRDLALARQLNPALQTFEAWLAANKDKIPVEAAAAGA